MDMPKQSFMKFKHLNSEHTINEDRNKQNTKEHDVYIFFVLPSFRLFLGEVNEEEFLRIMKKTNLF